jgi:hypothetical protein
VTRIDSVRAATGTARDSVRHAAAAVAPHAGTARDQAARYAYETRVRMAPKLSQAARQARATALNQYDARLQPRIRQSIRQARGTLPPAVDIAARQAAQRAREAARQAADFAVPRVGQAVAAAEPVREEAVQRGAAAIAALRGQVTPAEIDKLMRKRRRRAARKQGIRRALFAGLLTGIAAGLWKWWDKQSNPDWLVEPPATTEVGGRTSLTAVDGTEQSAPDPESGTARTEGGAEERNRGRRH